MPRPKILVVDDDPDLVRALRLRLRANNYEVATATDGYTAIASAQKERPALIILDLGLPVEDPFLVARVALQHEAEHGDEHEQQREQGDESVVGDQGGQLPRLIVTELLDDRRDEGQPAAALLAAVEVVEAVGEAHRPAVFHVAHGQPRPGRGNWRGGL